MYRDSPMLKMTHLFPEKMELLSTSYGSLSRLDLVDGSMFSHALSAQILESKITQVKKQIEVEQRKQNDNVQLYLKMAASSQRNQIPQLKSLFEKRNTKASNHINGLRRKLKKHESDLKLAQKYEEIKKSTPSPSPSPSKKPIAPIVKRASDGALNFLKRNSNSTGTSPNVSIPPEKKKFQGSSKSLDDELGTGKTRHEKNSTAEEEASGGSSELVETKSQSSSSSEVMNTSLSAAELNMIHHQLFEIRQDIFNIREDLDSAKVQATNKSEMMKQSIQEERYRVERLEDQVNDLTDLHLEETRNLKQALAEVEEKLSYKNDDHLRDLTDMLDSCQEKITRLEQQQQHLLTVEGMHNSTARVLIIQLVKGTLTLLQLLLLLPPIILTALTPLTQNRPRMFVSIAIGLAVFYIYQTWPQTPRWTINTWKNLLDRLGGPPS